MPDVDANVDAPDDSIYTLEHVLLWTIELEQQQLAAAGLKEPQPQQTRIDKLIIWTVYLRGTLQHFLFSFASVSALLQVVLLVLVLLNVRGDSEVKNTIDVVICRLLVLFFVAMRVEEDCATAPLLLMRRDLMVNVFTPAMRDGHFAQLVSSRYRLVCITAVVAAQMAIPLLALYVATMFVNKYSTVQDVVLNGVGVLFILDIDKVIGRKLLSIRRRHSEELELRGLFRNGRPAAMGVLTGTPALKAAADAPPLGSAASQPGGNGTSARSASVRSASACKVDESEEEDNTPMAAPSAPCKTAATTSMTPAFFADTGASLKPPHVAAAENNWMPPTPPTPAAKCKPPRKHDWLSPRRIALAIYLYAVKGLFVFCMIHVQGWLKHPVSIAAFCYLMAQGTLMMNTKLPTALELVLATREVRGDAPQPPHGVDAAADGVGAVLHTMHSGREIPAGELMPRKALAVLKASHE